MIRKTDYFLALTFVALLHAGCTNHVEMEVIDCEKSGPVISLEASVNPTDCESRDGSITVSAVGGKEPYRFSLNGGAVQSSRIFSALNGGTFTVRVFDANNCESTLDVALSIQSSDLAATYTVIEDTDCFSGNGSVTVQASGSGAPFQYSLNSASFSSVNTFSGLEAGTYSVVVRDAEGCSLSLNVAVARGETGISWNNEIKSIIDANCAVSGCHVSGGQNPNLSNLATAQSNASRIKLRTGNQSMPPRGSRSLSQQEITKIACWVDDGARNN
jgi:uncharacterized protein (DUF2141 family)